MVCNFDSRRRRPTGPYVITRPPPQRTVSTKMFRIDNVTPRLYLTGNQNTTPRGSIVWLGLFFKRSSGSRRRFPCIHRAMSLRRLLTTMAAGKKVPIPPRGVDYRGKIVLAPMVRSGELPSRLTALHYGADLVWGVLTPLQSLPLPCSHEANDPGNCRPRDD